MAKAARGGRERSGHEPGRAREAPRGGATGLRGAARVRAPSSKLLEIELVAARGTARERGLLAELARVLDEELMDDAGARAAYERLLASDPKDADAAEALDRTNAKRSKWRELLERYVQEAQGAGDPAFRSSLLVSAAEVVFRYGRERRRDRSPSIGSSSLLREALQLDPKNRRAEMLLERMLRDDGRWDDVAEALERFASEATQKDEKIAGWLRLARTFAKKLKSADRAAAAYERVLDVAPGQRRGGELPRRITSPRARCGTTSSRSTRASSRRARSAARRKSPARCCRSRWSTGGCAGGRRRPSPGSSGFASSIPAHPGMLSFFREWCTSRGESARLAAIFSDAQRATPDGPERGALVAEIAKLAEEGANAQKAIEQWRAVLRQDPAQQGSARRAEAPLPARPRAGTRSPISCGRSSTSSRPTTRPARLPGPARDRRRLPRRGQERLGARHGAHADRAARSDRPRERARARARLRVAAALARSC